MKSRITRTAFETFEMFKIFVLLFLIMYIPVEAVQMNKKDTEYWNFIGHQKRLMELAFKDYNPDYSPVYTIKHTDNETQQPEPMEINIKVVYLKLIEISEPEERVIFIIDYDMRWRDFRISWDPEDFGNITYFSIPRTKVWIPQLHIVNTHSLVDYRPDYQQLVLLNPDGTTTFYVSNVASIVCNMEVGDFPFDKQKCELMFVSNVYRKHEVEVNLEDYNVKKINKDLGTGEWQMLNVSAEMEVVEIEGCEVEVNKYVILLKRNSIFYVSMIIIPYFVINVLSIIGMFLVRHDRLGKLSISLTNLMSTTFILSILTDSVPKTHKLSLLSIYVMVNLSIMLVSVLGTIIIPLCYQRYKRYLVNTSGKYEQTESHEVPNREVKNYLLDKGNWNRMFFILLQAANVVNFGCLFL